MKKYNHIQLHYHAMIMLTRQPKISYGPNRAINNILNIKASQVMGVFLRDIIILIYRMAQLPDHIKSKTMLFVSHPVVDTINEALLINAVLDYRIAKYDAYIWLTFFLTKNLESHILTTNKMQNIIKHASE